ncbi:MAG: hypothetical protein LC745_08115 [Planctomycetia bacterium]|nr:hypothetical protein [Planctomycetia bacterium]
MRRRAFVPEAPGKLEGRDLLSGGLHLHHGAVPLSAPAFGLILLQTKGFFEQFALSGDLLRLKSQLAQGASTLPFHKAGMLGPKTNMILNQMEANIAAGKPGAINLAYQQTVDGLKDLEAKHIQDGTVFVYHK